MARLCSGCQKFASISEDAEPEVEANADGDKIQGTVTVRLESACCNETMAEAELEWNYTIQDSDHEHRTLETDIDEWAADNGEIYEVESVDAAFTSEQQTTARDGRPIRNSRYARMFYGAEITATVRCNACDVEFDVTDTVLEQASNFNDY